MGVNDSYLEVLQHYEGEPDGVRRGRGAWIWEQKDRISLLKEYRGTVKRLEFEEAVLHALREHGIPHVDQYIRNKEGELVTAGPDGTRYVLKEWFSERECSLRDTREILVAAEWIGRLHRAFQEIPWQEVWSMGSTIPPGLSCEMERHNREMKRVRTFIRGKRKKSEFELCVAASFEKFYEQALEAQEGLERLEKKNEKDRLFLCHGDLDQHHLLMKRDEAIFVEFHQMHRGSQMSDLSRFMRKIMEKHSWNEVLGLSLLERYEQENPLSETERNRLYYLLLYPEKYQKQLNYYNNSSKAWIPEKNVEKLKMLTSQQEKRMHFLEKIK